MFFKLTNFFRFAKHSNNIYRHFNDIKLGFIGAGNMASSMIEGFIKSEIINSKQIFAYDMDISKTNFLKSQFQILTEKSPEAIVNKADVITLAVKPNHMLDLLNQIRKCEFIDKKLISVAAGLNLEFYENNLTESAKVARIMPNIAVSLNQGTIGICSSSKCTKNDQDEMMSLLKLIAPVILKVSENQLDAITSLSGSGIAIGFVLLDALTDAGITVGLTPDESLLVASQTILGSLTVHQSTQLHPAQLKSKVCSAGGTTIYALNQLEEHKFRNSIIKAVVAGRDRAKELK